MVETGLGLLSRCRSRAGFVIPLLEQGWVCYPAAVGLALIELVWWRPSWVCYPAAGAGGVCYPAAVGLALIAIVWWRQGWVCYPAVRPGLGLLSRCRSKAGCVTLLLEVRFCS